MARIFYRVVTTSGKAHKFHDVKEIEDNQLEAYKAYKTAHLRDNKFVRPTTEIHFDIVGTTVYDRANTGFTISFRTWADGQHKTITLEW